MSYESCDLQTDTRYPFDPRANAFQLAKMENNYIYRSISKENNIHQYQQQELNQMEFIILQVHQNLILMNIQLNQNLIQLRKILKLLQMKQIMSQQHTGLVFSHLFQLLLFQSFLVSQLYIYLGFVLKMFKDFQDMFQRDGTRFGKKK